jgi:cardiolipin synthase
MDYRSFEINFEINALLYSEEVSKELKNHFNEDLKNCKELNLSQWERRPKIQKFQESVCRLIAPLL